MEIPKKLKIGAHTITVKVVDLDENQGDYDHRTGVIRISKHMPASQQASTLMHEIFHVMNSTIDHVFLDSLSEQFSQVLLDNNLLK